MEPRVSGAGWPAGGWDARLPGLGPARQAELVGGLACGLYMAFLHTKLLLGLRLV